MKSSSYTRQENEPCTSLLMTLPFLGIGIFGLVVVISTLLEWYQIKQWHEIEAYILEADLVTISTGKGWSSQTVARYRYTVDDRIYENTRVQIESDNMNSFNRTMYRQLEKYRGKNKPFRCYIDPTNPGKSVLFREIDWGLLGVIMLLPVFFGSVGLTGVIIFLNPCIFNYAKPVPVYPWSFPITWNIFSLPAWIMLYGAWNEGYEGYYGALWVAIFPLIGLLLIGLQLILLRRKQFF